MFLGPDLKRAESAESASSQEGRAILRAKPVCMQNLLSESPEGLDGCDTTPGVLRVDHLFYSEYAQSYTAHESIPEVRNIQSGLCNIAAQCTLRRAQRKPCEPRWPMASDERACSRRQR